MLELDLDVLGGDSEVLGSTGWSNNKGGGKGGNRMCADYCCCIITGGGGRDTDTFDKVFVELEVLSLF